MKFEGEWVELLTKTCFLKQYQTKYLKEIKNNPENWKELQNFNI